MVSHHESLDGFRWLWLIAALAVATYIIGVRRSIPVVTIGDITGGT